MDSFASNWATAIQQLLPDTSYRFFPTAINVSGNVYLNFSMNSGIFYTRDSSSIALQGSNIVPGDINKSLIYSFYLHTTSATRIFNCHTINGSTVTSADWLASQCNGISLRGTIYKKL